MDIFEKINGKCYKITFSKRVKQKSGKIQFPPDGKKAITLKKRVDDCNCKE